MCNSTRKINLIKSGPSPLWQGFAVGFENRRKQQKGSFETEKHIILQRKTVTVLKNSGFGKREKKRNKQKNTSLL